LGQAALTATNREPPAREIKFTILISSAQGIFHILETPYALKQDRGKRAQKYGAF
jgi:hypothetical protein